MSQIDPQNAARELLTAFKGMLIAAAVDSRLQSSLEKELAEYDFCKWVIKRDAGKRFGLKDLPPANLAWLSASIADAYDYITSFGNEWLNPVVRDGELSKIKSTAEKLEQMLSQYDLNYPKRYELVLMLRDFIAQQNLAYANRGGANRKVPRQVAIKKLYADLEKLFPDWLGSKRIAMIAHYLEDVDPDLGEQQVRRLVQGNATELDVSADSYAIKRRVDEARKLLPTLTEDQLVAAVLRSFDEEAIKITKQKVLDALGVVEVQQ